MADATPPCAAPMLLTRAHDGSAFDSGEAVLDDWLRQRVWHDPQSAASRAYVACPRRSPRIVGYLALSMGQILVQDVPGSVRRNIPAVTLGRPRRTVVHAISSSCNGSVHHSPMTGRREFYDRARA